MAKHKTQKKDAGPLVINTSYIRIIPSGDGRYARIMLDGKSKFVKVGSQDFHDALAMLADLVGGDKVALWLRNLGW
ncbi:MAG: hypothetical protein WCH00_02580 [Candidatus Saccharibacteria bacterium]